MRTRVRNYPLLQGARDRDNLSEVYYVLYKSVLCTCSTVQGNWLLLYGWVKDKKAPYPEYFYLGRGFPCLYGAARGLKKAV
jgi:hypothetical protein